MAPSRMAASMTRHRKSRSLRVASSAENSTSSVNCRARRTPSSTSSRHVSRVMRSLRGEVQIGGREERVDARPLGRLRARAPPPRCPAAGERASAAMVGRRTSAAICRTASASAGDAIGKPASMMSTPSASSARASVSLAGTSSEKPGACSPSRSVVSKMTTRAATVAHASFVAVGQARSQSDNDYQVIR